MSCASPSRPPSQQAKSTTEESSMMIDWPLWARLVTQTQPSNLTWQILMPLSPNKVQIFPDLYTLIGPYAVLRSLKCSKLPLFMSTQTRQLTMRPPASLASPKMSSRKKQSLSLMPFKNLDLQSRVRLETRFSKCLHRLTGSQSINSPSTLLAQEHLYLKVSRIAQMSLTYTLSFCQKSQLMKFLISWVSMSSNQSRAQPVPRQTANPL